MKIVLIDDEPKVIEGLNLLIEWDKHKLECAGTAANGRDGLALIKEQTPDIAIVDIHMPVINGFELIEKCREEMKNPPEFIILCGYSETELVRKAMKNNISAFMLKPIDALELNEILAEFIKKINTQRVKRETEEVIGGNILNRILNGDGSDEVFDSFAKHLGIDIEENITYLFLDIAKYNDFDVWNDDVNELNKKRVVTDLLKSFMDDGCENHIFNIESGVFSIILNHNNRSRIKALCDNIIEKLDNEYALKTAAVVVPNIKISQLRRAYMDCVDCSRSLSEYNIVMWCDRQSLQKSYQMEKYSVAPIIEAVSGGDLNLIDRILDSDFKRFEVHGNPLILMRGFATSLFLEIMQLSDLGGEEVNAPLNQLFKRISTARNMYELKEVCKEMCYFVVGVLLELEDTRKALTENDIVAYIKAHYAESLSLDMLYEKFHIKQTTLSRIIKEKTGYKFKDYLNIVRVHNAQKLIMSSNKKIMQIAMEVGYKDYCYFVRKFKAVFGEIPSEYKKAHKNF